MLYSTVSNYQFINDKTDKLDKIIYTSRNHAGFRGERPPSNFAECLTIIAVGGSTTECVLISDGKTWCDILAKKLQTRFKPCWLGNGGLDGTSFYGHITFMEDYIIITQSGKEINFLPALTELKKVLGSQKLIH